MHLRESEYDTVPEAANAVRVSEFAVGAEKQNAGNLLSRVRQLLNDDLQAVEQLLERSLASRHELVGVLGQQATGLGGKRLRPCLVLLAAKALEGCADTEYRPRKRDLHCIAASVELVHAASLVHDDVMDAALERRHRPTICSRSGNASAILLGDFLFTRAYGVAASCKSAWVARHIAAASTRLCEGELLQQLSAGNWLIDGRNYRRILAEKTGALCAVSCRLGSRWAGATLARQRALDRFGLLLGVAFQIYDDWLDYWGTANTGKALGNDLQQSKATLPLIRLLESLPAGEREDLLVLLAGESDQQVRFERVRAWLDASDASEYTLAMAGRCVNRAKSLIEDLPSSPAKECLLSVADFSIGRDQ
ncbi:MAG: polyprenyl synthetase family protein [Planctomycetales bacterium]|nr:polyprenyl synthetase family protein [Planctomycetales bacterium]